MVIVKNVPRVEAYFREMELWVVTGSRSLGSLIGEHIEETEWLEEKVQE